MTKDLDKKVAHAMELHYERGFIDGMQKQMQSSVDMAVNRMAQTQEPVAWMDADGNVSDNNDHKCFPIPLYTHPPQTQEPDDIASILACRDMLDAQPVPPRTTG